MAIDDGFLFLSNERQLPMPDWWLEDFLVEGSVTMYSAQPKCGKSAWAAHLAYAAATGTPFFGRALKQGVVLYLAGERGHQTEDRLLLLFGESDPINIVVLIPTLGSLGSIKFNHEGDPQKLVNELNRRCLSPSLIIVDTLSNFFEGEQNNESDMGTFFDGVRSVCDQFGASGVVLHHDNKEYVDRHNRRSGGTSFRGSGAALARVDAYIRARVVNELPDRDDPRGERTVKIVDIELAEDNWGGSFQQKVAVRKLLEDPNEYLTNASDAEALDELVLEVLERVGEISVKDLEVSLNMSNDVRLRGRQFTRRSLGEVRARVGDRIIERRDPADKRSTLLSIRSSSESQAA
jgi:RecA-family ATPase